MLSEWILLDVDGCVRKPHEGLSPEPPPLFLRDTVQKLAPRYRFAFGTGADLSGARLTAFHLGLEDVVIAASYCGLLSEQNGHAVESFLVPEEERHALAAITSELEAIAAEFAPDRVTDRGGVCFSFHPPCQLSFEAACRKAEPLLIAAGDLLRFKPTRHDRGVVVACASAKKQLLVNRLRGPGNRIVVAGGDSDADATFLEAAEFPIVTIADEEALPNPTLVAIVEHKRCGFVATKPHGFGLTEGLYAAREAGVVNF